MAAGDTESVAGMCIYIIHTSLEVRVIQGLALLVIYDCGTETATGQIRDLFKVQSRTNSLDPYELRGAGGCLISVNIYKVN